MKPITLKQLTKHAYELYGINVKQASTKSDGLCVAIHLLNPSQRKLEQAIEQAERDMFPTVMIHNESTWIGLKGSVK